MLSPDIFAVREAYKDSEVVPQSFRHVGTRMWERGAIVLYYVVCLQGKDTPLAGQALRMFKCNILEHTPHFPDGWCTIGGGGFDAPDEVDSLDSPLHYAYGTGGGGPFAVVFGYTVSFDVHTVEVTFSNGAVLRDVVQNGVFAVLCPQLTRARDMRVLQQDGVELHHYILASEDNV
jgi:hypothetical protein